MPGSPHMGMLVVFLGFLVLQMVAIGCVLTRNEEGLEWAIRRDECRDEGAPTSSTVASPAADVSFYTFRFCVAVESDNNAAPGGNATLTGRICHDYEDAPSQDGANILQDAQHAYAIGAALTIVNLVLSYSLILLIGFYRSFVPGSNSSRRRGVRLFRRTYIAVCIIIAMVSATASIVGSVNMALIGPNDTLEGMLGDPNLTCELQRRDLGYSVCVHIGMVPWALVQACALRYDRGCRHGRSTSRGTLGSASMTSEYDQATPTIRETVRAGK